MPHPTATRSPVPSPRRLPRGATTLCALALAAGAWGGAARAADAPVQPVSVRAVAHFGFDRTGILPADQQRILAEVAQMKDVTWQTVTATGHTDSAGTPAYNRKLATRRAAAVKAYLVGKGLDASMIETASAAADAPVASNATAAGRAQNRRTEIEFRGVRTVASR